MKKTFTLAICLMASVASFAQATADSFVFQDAEGNVVPDGSVLTRTELTENPFDKDYISSGLYVVNVSPGAAYLTIESNITQLPSGTSHSICFPGNCITHTAVGTYVSKNPEGEKADVKNDMKAEWIPEGVYGTCTVTYTVKEYEYEGKQPNAQGIPVDTYSFIGNGPSVTVNYVNVDPAGISQTTAETGVVSTVYYDLQGRCTVNPGKGLYIKKVKTTDGNTKTVKTVLR